MTVCKGKRNPILSPHSTLQTYFPSCQNIAREANMGIQRIPGLCKQFFCTFWTALPLCCPKEFLLAVQTGGGGVGVFCAAPQPHGRGCNTAQLPKGAPSAHCQLCSAHWISQPFFLRSCVFHQSHQENIVFNALQ